MVNTFWLPRRRDSTMAVVREISGRPPLILHRRCLQLRN
jgi:hypothetical protein